MLVRKGNESHFGLWIGITFKVICQVEYLAFSGIRIDHGDAHALGGQRPKGHHVAQSGTAFLALHGILHGVQLSEQVGLLILIQ